MLPTSSEVARLLRYLTPDERAEVHALLSRQPWTPLPGPQVMAYTSKATVIGFGGAAGGGKTDLAVGKALTQHRKSIVLRVNGTELTGILDRFAEVIGNRDGYNGRDNIWRLGAQQIEFGSVPNAGDEKKFQGRPHDLLVFDEAANFLEAQVRFLLGWLRTTTPGQACQALLTFNPPTTVEGRWIVAFFAPWIDPKYPGKRATPGELRWFAMVDGEEREVDDTRPFVMVAGERVYDFDPSKFKPTEIVTPQSRTFIPSRITDNRYLMGTGYMTTLQALPEPLRSQMLLGDFAAGMSDDPWQVIPTKWVEIAQARWKLRDVKGRMDSIGVDVARGGKDKTTIAPRHHGYWFDEVQSHPGSDTPDGPKVAGLVIAASRDRAPIHLDVIGVGASPYDFLVQAKQPVIGVNGAEATTGTDASGRLRFFNARSEMWWRMRESLDPAADNGIALPPGREILVDLCTPKWELRGAKIYVQSREEIIADIGRSPDIGTALCLANLTSPVIDRGDIPGAGIPDSRQREHDPYANLR